MTSTLSFALSVLVGATVGVGELRAEALQTPAALLFSAAFVLGAWQPDGAWRRGVVLGLSVPMAHGVAHVTGTTMPFMIADPWLTVAAIVPALMGTGIGMGVSRLRQPSPRDERPRG
ncbi:MAG: hypothetical protein MUF40_01715 [Gemmatimonadaceae bacterium]|jgi:NO-binding membrane sensor protein with MHYT domain|nr:hypothetical protein [Gemmatimonadaceae bacterium]